MYPDVNQYMIPWNLRAPTQDQVGILCPCSSSSSASLKGLERYVTSPAGVCRCYYMMGIRSVLQKLCTDIPVSGCVCHIVDTEDLHIVHIAGIRSNLCALCYRMLEHIIISNLSESPHSPTLHYNESGYVTLSFCSGTLMAQSHENMWYDSMSRSCTTQHYQRIVSPAASLVCFPQCINPVRLGLSIYTWTRQYVHLRVDINSILQRHHNTQRIQC